MAKTPNYTAEQTAQLVAAYTAAENQDARDSIVAEFAESFNKSPASIRAKLSTEGVYVAKTYTTKTGGKPETKDAIVDAIATACGVNADVFDSLSKANKNVLRMLRDNLTV